MDKNREEAIICYGCGTYLEKAKFCPECGLAAGEMPGEAKRAPEQPRQNNAPVTYREPERAPAAQTQVYQLEPVDAELAQPQVQNQQTPPEQQRPYAQYVQTNVAAAQQTVVYQQNVSTVVNNTQVNANTSYAPSYVPVQYHGGRKNKVLALLLCAVLGVIGAHQFYTGKVGMGLLYLFTGGLFGIGWIIDLIMIALGSFRDSNGLLLE